MLGKGLNALLAVVLGLLSFLFVPLHAHALMLLGPVVLLVLAWRLAAHDPVLSNQLLLAWYLGYVLLIALIGHLSLMASAAIGNMFQERPEAKVLTDYLGGGVTAYLATAFVDPFSDEKGGLWPSQLFRAWLGKGYTDIQLQDANADQAKAFDAARQDRVYDGANTLIDGWDYVARRDRAKILKTYRDETV